jgi:hypothetical protein
VRTGTASSRDAALPQAPRSRAQPGNGLSEKSPACPAHTVLRISHQKNIWTTRVVVSCKHMWEPSFTRQKLTAQKSKSVPHAVTLKQLMDTESDRLIQARERVPELKMEADRLVADSVGMTARHEYRKRNDHLCEAEELRDEIKVRESRYREVQFAVTRNAYERLEAAVTTRHRRRDAPPPYGCVESHRTTLALEDTELSDASSSHPFVKDHDESTPYPTCVQNGDNALEKEERPHVGTKIVTPPGVEHIRTHDAMVKLTQSRDALRSALVQEYGATLPGSVPRLQPRPSDVCPFCSVPLMLHVVRSVMVCRRCGYGVAYLDSTTSNVCVLTHPDSPCPHSPCSHSLGLRSVSLVDTRILPTERSRFRNLHVRRSPTRRTTTSVPSHTSAFRTSMTRSSRCRARSHTWSPTRWSTR